MPRGPRLDYPGALHHVIARGIERRKIFYCDRDREAFLSRLENLVLKSGAGLYAWALMTNHAHFLLRTGAIPLSRLAQRWLGPYALCFNLVHDRAGHLFQNRFKSILVEEDPYLLELVRYIHLNPVKSSLPITIDDLDHYPWTGHAALLGNSRCRAQDVDFVLAQFGDTTARARRAYREFVRDGMCPGAIPDLEGGGLRRSAGGTWRLVDKLSGGREEWVSDERILGGSEFVESVLRQVNERGDRVGQAVGPETLEELCTRVAAILETTPQEIRSASRRCCVLDSRAIISQVAVHHYGFTIAATTRLLCLSRQSVIRALDRAPRVLAERGIHLPDLIED